MNSGRIYMDGFLLVHFNLYPSFPYMLYSFPTLFFQTLHVRYDFFTLQKTSK